MTVLSRQQTVPLLCTSRHIAKDCPKSTSASSKAREHPALSRTSPCLPAQTQKKTEQSSRIHTTQGLHWTPSCEIHHSQCIHSFKPRLTHSFHDLWHSSWHDPKVPRGFWIFRLLYRFCVCSDSAYSRLWHSAYQASTHWWNLQFCHLAALVANPLSYQGISNSDFLCHSIGPELHDCTRIPLAHCYGSTTGVDTSSNMET